MKQPTFTLTFGREPSSYVERHTHAKQICDDFSLDYPFSNIYVISGVRGSGKTVLLTKISADIAKKDEWIVIDANPNREILAQVAAGLYENASVKHLFLSPSFSISFSGFGFSIQGKEPVSNIKTVVEKMLEVVKKRGKKVLITIDEACNNAAMRSFSHDFQSLLRGGYPLFSLMTGLYENVDSLQRNKNLTFLYRAPKIELKPLDAQLVKEAYGKVFVTEEEETLGQLASITKGYAFAYQLVGYLYSKYGDIDKIYDELDTYLSIYAYDKTWESLPASEKKLILAFDGCESSREALMRETGYSDKEYSVYRDRLIKRGLVDGDTLGRLSFVLPRFDVFLAKHVR